MKKTTTIRKPAEKSCLLIQWQREQVPTDGKGHPVCPKCGKPAKMVLGVFGQPCWAHK